MAYEFVKASSQQFEALNAIANYSASQTLTLHARVRYPSNADGDGILALFDSGFSPARGVQLRHVQISTSFFLAVGLSGSSGTPGDTESLPGTNAWYSGVGVIRASNNRQAYVNTTSNGNNAGNVVGVSTASLAVGRSLTNVYWNGQLAELAVWDVALNADELNSLSAGFKPYRIRPQSLVHYIPLTRDVIEPKGGIALTASASAPTVYEHPRVY